MTHEIAAASADEDAADRLRGVDMCHIGSLEFGVGS